MPLEYLSAWFTESRDISAKVRGWTAGRHDRSTRCGDESHDITFYSVSHKWRPFHNIIYFTCQSNQGIETKSCLGSSNINPAVHAQRVSLNPHFCTYEARQDPAISPSKTLSYHDLTIPQLLRTAPYILVFSPFIYSIFITLLRPYHNLP